MSEYREIPNKDVLDAIAEGSGLSVVVVNSQGVELSASNNNSICRSLNPDGRLSEQCAAFCGAALAEARELKGHAAYVCHAGLECRASCLAYNGGPAAVIVGRTFATTENYRRATERAISGDWQHLSPAALFENVLLSASPDAAETGLNEIEAKATKSTAPDVPKEGDLAAVTEPEKGKSSDLKTPDIASRQAPSESSTGAPLLDLGFDRAALRSFFASILQMDYKQASRAFLELLAASYGFTSLVWFERKDGRLISSTAFGTLEGRRIVLGMSADDARLTDAIATAVPVILTERLDPPESGLRTMYVFPAPVGQDVSAALAIVGATEDAEILHQISRLCTAAGPQLEILRLRREVSTKTVLASSVRRFSEEIKDVDSDDIWLGLTRVAAELMQAERGSLLVLNEDTNALEIKAAIGARRNIAIDPDPGRRVARTVLERGRTALVSDVRATGLPPLPPERGYKTDSFLSSPITLGGREIAVINFTDKASGDAFGRADVELIGEISPHLSAAIERAILKHEAGQFQQLSVTDALTGLLNRRYMDQRLTEEVKRSNRHGYPMSFIMVDVDHFKSYNDNFGHPAGDEALRLVGKVLRNTLRGADVAARYGGEEFVVLLPQTNADEAAVLAERLRANVESTSFPHRPVTISVGVATCTSDRCTTDGLLLAADNALYHAKNTGRNRVHSHGEIESEATDSE